MEVIQGENLTNNVFDNVPMVPPFTLDTIEINEETKDIPGRIVMDEQGKYFKEYIAYEGFSDFLTRGYNYMVDTRLPNFIRNFHVLKTNTNSTIHFDDIRFTPAGLLGDQTTYPNMARMRGSTYSSKIFATLVETTLSKDVLIKENVYLGTIPVMLGSNKCVLSGLNSTERHRMGENLNDPDGYYIVTGTERIILIQDELRMNRILLYNEDNKGKLVCRMTIPTEFQNKKKVELIYDNDKKSINLYLDVFTSGQAYGISVKNDIPVFLLYAFFDYENIDMILSHILKFAQEKHHQRIVFVLTGSIVEYENRSTDIHAFIYRLKYQKKIPTDTYEEEKRKIQNEVISGLFPNMDKEPLMRKLDMLAMMIVRMAEYKAGVSKLDDRDSWANKALITGNQLVENLFRNIWIETIKGRDGIQAMLSRKSSASSDNLDLVSRDLNSLKMMNIFVKSFKTGDWGIPGKSTIPNTTEVLNRNSLLAPYSHIRRINTPRVDANSKQDTLRMVHFSALHYVCPIETPEGTKIGIVKNMTSVCRITLDLDDTYVRNILSDYVYVDKNTEMSVLTKIMLNGKFIGWTNGEITYSKLRELKLNGTLNMETCIVQDELNYLYVHTDASRMLAPYLTVNDDTLQMDVLRTKIYNKTGSRKMPKFSTLLENGAAEYVDAFEQSGINLVFSREELNNRVNIRKQNIEKINKDLQDLPEGADTDRLRLHSERSKLINKKQITHCDIDPTAMMSIAASIIPYAHKMQAPRNTYQASHGKQALGIFSTNHKSRMDTSSKVLAYPSRPLFEPQMNDLIGLNQQPAGQMVTLALMTYGGWEQEDAIVLNRASVDRGLFMSIKYYDKSNVLEKGMHTPDDPDTSIAYHDEFGIPPKNRDDDVYRHLGEDGMPKLNSYVKEGDCIIGKMRVSGKQKWDMSVYMDVGEKGIIDRVTILKNAAQHYVAHVKIRDVRKPLVGDKFASRYAQKATVGHIAKVIDIPFTVNGITPDVIINPLPIAGRMTMGKIFEIIGSKTMALKGEFINATSFRSFDENDFTKTLEAYGYSFDGEETMYDGKTGKKIESKIFTGPCYYQALRHQVVDKVQARGYGPKEQKTGQPTKGRAVRGAIRLGGMERDALISHGAAGLIKERMMYSSDAVDINVCLSCGKTTTSNECTSCNSTNVGKLTTTSIFLRLRNLLSAAGIDVRIIAETAEQKPPADEDIQVSDELQEVYEIEDKTPKEAEEEEEEEFYEDIGEENY